MSDDKKEKAAANAVETSARLLRVREQIYSGLSRLLKPYGLTEPQFNVLRILRGAGPDGLPSLEVGRRMITRIPDVTRLLDRLEAEKLVVRTRGENDRRVVVARLTLRGKELLSRLDDPVRAFLEYYKSPLTAVEQRRLNGLLDKLLKANS